MTSRIGAGPEEDSAGDVAPFEELAGLALEPDLASSRNTALTRLSPPGS